jgi:hypothetical protein
MNFLLFGGPILTCLDPKHSPKYYKNSESVLKIHSTEFKLESHYPVVKRLTGKELDDGEEGEDDPVGEPLLVVLLVQRLQRLDRAECRVRESA